MAISKDLFLSILAMDAYNQGYDPGIAHGETRIGAATVNRDSLILNDDPNDPNRVDQATSFYAIAYEVGPNGPAGLADKTVISYRSTNDPNPFSRTYPFVDLNIGPITGCLVGASRTGSPVPRCGYGRQPAPTTRPP